MTHRASGPVNNPQRFLDPLRNALDKLEDPWINFPASYLLFTGGGAAAAVLFTSIGPVGGAVFGFTSTFAAYAFNLITGECHVDSDSMLGKAARIAKAVLPGGIGAAAGWCSLYLLGYAVTPLSVAALFFGGFGIAVSTVAVVIVVAAAILYCYTASQAIVQDNAGAIPAFC